MTRRRVAIVTPWYPTLDQPYRGAFVRAAVQATGPACDRLTVYHCDDWAHALPPEPVFTAYRTLLPHTPSADTPTAAGVHAVYLPVPFRSGQGYAEVARR
ncbi:MAG: glycosyltransferase family 4 protein, partial [Betaproteobacteria bacterium]